MEVSALTLRVLLLFFPGVLCALLVDALTVHRERTSAQFLTHAFVLGLASYLLLYAGRWACAEAADALRLPPPPPVSFIDALLNDRLRIAWGEIVLAAAVALPLGMAVAAGINHKVLYRIGRTLRVTRRRGSPDLWSHVFDSPQTTWITVRDLERGYTYFGWVQEYSETALPAELWLGNVAVYSSATGALLYHASNLYLSHDPRSVTIEVLPPGTHTGGANERENLRMVDSQQVQPKRPQSGSDASSSGLHAGSVGAATSLRGEPDFRGYRVARGALRTRPDAFGTAASYDVERGGKGPRAVATEQIQPEWEQHGPHDATTELHTSPAEAAAGAGDQPAAQRRRAALNPPVRLIAVRVIVPGGAVRGRLEGG
jgi:hypothetical protein